LAKSIILPILLILVLAGCATDDDSIAADGCEGIKDEFTCRQFGCTPTCGVVFLGSTVAGSDCMARVEASLWQTIIHR